MIRLGSNGAKSHSTKCSSSLCATEAEEIRHKSDLKASDTSNNITRLMQHDMATKEEYKEKAPPRTVASFAVSLRDDPLKNRYWLKKNKWNESFLTEESALLDNEKNHSQLSSSFSYENTTFDGMNLNVKKNDVELDLANDLDFLKHIHISSGYEIIEKDRLASQASYEKGVSNIAKLHNATETVGQTNLSLELPSIDDSNAVENAEAKNESTVPSPRCISPNILKEISISPDKEQDSVVPPPMLFIPIFMPPIVQNPQMALFNLMPAPSKISADKIIRPKQSRKLFLKTKHQKRGKRRGRDDPQSRTLSEKIMLRRPSVYVPRNQVKVDLNRFQRHRRNFICNWIEVMIKYSTATVGRTFDTSSFGDKAQYKYFPSATVNRLVHGFDPIERKIEHDDANTEERNIIPSSMEHIRQTYSMQCKVGVVRNPSEEEEDTEDEEENVVGTFDKSDNLYVIVGLTNIFILQFIMVIIIFFAKS